MDPLSASLRRTAAFTGRAATAVVDLSPRPARRDRRPDCDARACEGERRVCRLLGVAARTVRAVDLEIPTLPRPFPRCTRLRLSGRSGRDRGNRRPRSSAARWRAPADGALAGGDAEVAPGGGELRTDNG